MVARAGGLAGRAYKPSGRAVGMQVGVTPTSVQVDAAQAVPPEQGKLAQGSGVSEGHQGTARASGMTGRVIVQAIE